MARFARELQDKVTWGQMSERWLRCAELSEKETRAARARGRQSKPMASP